MQIENLETLPNEEWREHPIGVFVSNLGKIFIPENKSRKPHYTYGYTNSDGYKRIGWKCKLYLVHRLVAECFIENSNNYPTVDHINRNKTDNRVENLRWANRKMQQLNRETTKQVVQINPSTNDIIKIWKNAQECERNGFKRHGVYKCCNGLRKRYMGYKWGYIKKAS